MATQHDYDGCDFHVRASCVDHRSHNTRSQKQFFESATCIQVAPLTAALHLITCLLESPYDMYIYRLQLNCVYLCRLQFCPAEVQRKWFARQFDLARDSGLPLFLHMRAAADDMLAILRNKRSYYSGGVVHSFDGTLQQAQSILSLSGLCIGNVSLLDSKSARNGCVHSLPRCSRVVNYTVQ